MKSTIYEKYMRVNSCRVDTTSHMSIAAAMGTIQDMVSEQTGLFGMDDFNMKSKSNGLWVMNKVKLQINKMPFWNDAVKLTSRMLKPTGVQCRWDFLAADEQETPLWLGRAEMCILDFDSHHIRRVNSTCYPPGLDFPEANRLKFERFSPDADSENYVYTRVIRAGDIDIVHHTNNVQYNTIALDAFTAAELEATDISEYEIDFLSESHEHDRLDIYRTKAEDGFIVTGTNYDNGKAVFKTKIICEKRNTA